MKVKIVPLQGHDLADSQAKTASDEHHGPVGLTQEWQQ